MILCSRMAKDPRRGRDKVQRNPREGRDSLQPTRSITTGDQERYERRCPESSHQDVGYLRHLDRH